MWTPKKESKFRGSQMSRKEVAAAVGCSTTTPKSKQFPRFFRNRRSSSVSLVWPYVDVNAGSVITEQIETSSLTSLTDENKRLLIEDKNNKFKTKNNEEGNGYTEIVWCLDHSSTFPKCVPSDIGAVGVVDNPEDKTGDVETVASIEKWLKTRTESISSMDLDVTKSDVEEENVERYLTNDLTHSFLPKDPDVLSIDIDLSDKKLNLNYEHSILQELQTEKLLDVCGKDDEFILPEFRLDQLDPLALSPDDMMVAGEILPSTSGPTSLTTPNEHLTDTSNKSDKEEAQLIDRTEETENHTSMVDSTELTNLPIVFENINVMQDTPEANNIVSSPKSASNSFTDVLNNDDVIENTTDIIDVANSGNNIMEQLKSKTRIKLEPRIIKKRRRISDKFDDKMKSKENVMTVVAISTDKITNMTQIVINTGTEEQVYQGKTSELIEATGNFPKLPRIDTSPAWNGSLECNNSEMNPSSQHEMIISNALAELGVTDLSLQPVTVSEHGKLWLCPKEDCNKQFNRQYALKGHLLSHFGVRPFKCDNEGCTWAFYSEFKLKRHKETHSKRKDYACQIEGCNRRFTTIYNLWSHQKLHTRPNRIKCHVPNCQEKFQTKRALELHMRSHDQSHAPYVCKHEGCGKRYYSSNALTSHQRCHSYKEIDVKCSWPGCGKVFDKPCRLKAHIRSHTGCKPYLCTFQGCQWAFSSSSKLKRHQKKHTNERKFICDVASCGKAFMRSEHLKEHRLTHKEGRYFQCCICNTQFSAKSSLYVHIKKHQNKEDIERNICKETFSESFEKNRFIMTESHCSKANSFIIQNQKSIELNKELISQNDSTPVLSQPRETNLNNDDENQSIEMISNQDEIKTLYYCPVETCTRSYSTKATLRAHMSKIHGTPIGDCDKSLKSKSTDIIDFNNMDYVLYAPPSSASESNEQMVMVTPCDAVVVNTPSEMDSLPETQPPLLDIVLRNNSIHENATNEQLLQTNVKKDHGSARTNLTFLDVCKLKTKDTPTSSIAGASDVTLGASDMKGELLFTEELPSMYYQDDVGGTEYQVLLLDSGPSESAVNLRGLE